MDEKNQVTVKISGDAAEVNKLIERLQNQNPEIKIKLNTTDAEKKIKSLFNTSLIADFLNGIQKMGDSAINTWNNVSKRIKGFTVIKNDISNFAKDFA